MNLIWPGSGTLLGPIKIFLTDQLGQPAKESVSMCCQPLSCWVLRKHRPSLTVLIIPCRRSLSCNPQVADIKFLFRERKDSKSSLIIQKYEDWKYDYFFRFASWICTGAISFFFLFHSIFISMRSGLTSVLFIPTTVFLSWFVVLFCCSTTLQLNFSWGR